MARWISFSERFVLPVMVMFCSRPVPRSLAETFTTPLTSISKVTSIWGLDEKLARMPFNLNLPRLLLSRAKCRSPCRTLISTLVCMGRAVVNIWLLRVGIMLLRVMRGVATPPSVSMERVSGVTSISTRPCAAAPEAPVSAVHTALPARRSAFPTSISVFVSWDLLPPGLPAPAGRLPAYTSIRMGRIMGLRLVRR